MGVPLAVYPPKGEADADTVWVRHAAMYGTRRASMLFGNFVREKMIGGGDEVVPVPLQAYCNGTVDVDCLLHGDEFMAREAPLSFDVLGILLEHQFEIKKLHRVGPGASREGPCLKGNLTWSEKGFGWQQDESHSMKMVDAMETNLLRD